MWDNMAARLVQQGFQPMGCNIRNVAVLSRIVEEQMDICIMVRNMQGIFVNGEQLKEINFQIERKFLLQGYRQISLMNLVFSDNPEQEKRLSEQDFSFWVYDVLTNRMLIYENQPEEYFGLYAAFDEMLAQEIRGRKEYVNRLPFLNISIVLINIVIFLIYEIWGSTLSTEFMKEHGAAYGPYIFEEQRYYLWISSMFLHFGFEHLANNMISLLLAGNIVEAATGKVRYFFIYMTSGLVSSIVSSCYYYNQDRPVVSAGASGAIFGVIGAMLVLTFKNRKQQIERGVPPIRMLLVIVLMILNGAASEGVDNVAHIIGLFTGVIMMMLIGKREKKA